MAWRVRSEGHDMWGLGVFGLFGGLVADGEAVDGDEAFGGAVYV